MCLQRKREKKEEEKRAPIITIDFVTRFFFHNKKRNISVCNANSMSNTWNIIFLCLFTITACVLLYLLVMLCIWVFVWPCQAMFSICVYFLYIQISYWTYIIAMSFLLKKKIILLFFFCFTDGEQKNALYTARVTTVCKRIYIYLWTLSHAHHRYCRFFLSFGTFSAFSSSYECDIIEREKNCKWIPPKAMSSVAPSFSIYVELQAFFSIKSIVTKHLQWETTIDKLQLFES